MASCATRSSSRAASLPTSAPPEVPVLACRQSTGWADTGSILQAPFVNRTADELWPALAPDRATGYRVVAQLKTSLQSELLPTQSGQQPPGLALLT